MICPYCESEYFYDWEPKGEIEQGYRKCLKCGLYSELDIDAAPRAAMVSLPLGTEPAPNRETLT